MRKTIAITDFERKNYVLDNEKNIKILEIIKKIERYKLNKKDKKIIKEV
ncbi:hypothetical protein J4229_00435 [Candidatus Pacearchaeota archaeon]|nr:hypothetical protein [Candidatus Pacearchaeota archaeon]